LHINQTKNENILHTPDAQMYLASTQQVVVPKIDKH